MRPELHKDQIISIGWFLLFSHIISSLCCSLGHLCRPYLGVQVNLHFISTAIDNKDTLPMNSRPTQPCDSLQTLLINHDTLLYICQTWTQKSSLHSTLITSCQLVQASWTLQEGNLFKSPADLFYYFYISHKHITVLPCHPFLPPLFYQRIEVSILCQSSSFSQRKRLKETLEG